MRINVYSEEMTDEIELITKEGVIGADGKPTTFYGVRFYLESSEKMHRTEHDDDRSAVTFWFGDSEFDAGQLAGRFRAAGNAIEDAVLS